MDVVTLSKVLNHYKRSEVQQAIVSFADKKEAVGSYGGKGYAKRPDVLVYPQDVFELVKNGVTSFHLSEETWTNPLNIVTGMKPGELNNLRVGWDLVLDIDCPFWEFAKLVTYLFTRSLQDHNIKSISVKFSGNKGFHIGVPFEAFPKTYNDVPTKDLFPEGPRKIAKYLLKYIGDKYIAIKGDTIIFAGQFAYPFDEIQRITKKPASALLHSFCQSCGATDIGPKEKQYHFSCPSCGAHHATFDDIDYRKCEKCNLIMERSVLDLEKKCCTSPNIVQTFNPLSIVEVDTVLIASRHLYRAPFSYHEKSQLISIPIPPSRIMDFEKKEAELENIRYDVPFMDRSTADRSEGYQLLHESFELHSREEQKKALEDDAKQYKTEKSGEFEEITEAIPETCFPPCILKILKGLEDGKKRAMFVLINFLASCGWDYDQIEARLKEWNKVNSEPLREVTLLGQIRYAKMHKKKVLPPNCDNQGYYKDFGVCLPDNLCKKIKNPVNYAVRKARFLRMKGKESSSSDTKTENQKE